MSPTEIPRRAARAARRELARIPRRGARRARRMGRRLRRRVRRAARRIRHSESALWRLLRRPRLLLQLYEDDRERLLHALSRARGEVRFVQIGANDGIRADPLRLFVLKDGWSGLMIEPLGGVFARLERTYRGFPGISLENVAIASSGGVREFFQLVGDGEAPAYLDLLGSLDPEPLRERAASDPALRLISSPVRCMTFDAVCEKHGVSSFDLIVIDTEGYDFEVIKTIDFKRFQPAGLIYEHGLLDGEARAACRSHLAEQGYETAELARDTLALANPARSHPALARAWRTIRRRSG